MNVQDAIKKINQVGGNFSRLSGGELYEVFKALQDSFTYSDEFSRLSTYARGNQPSLSADKVLQDKILSGVKVNSQNLEEFKNMYEAVNLFSSSKVVRNKFATEAYKVIENYNILNTFSPEDLDVVESIAKNLKEDIDNNVIKVKAKEKNLVDNFIKKVDKEIDIFVKANDLENVHLLDAKAIQKGWDAVEKANLQLENATGIYAQESKKIEDMLMALDFDAEDQDPNSDPVTIEQFRQDLYDLATEEALRKCALDPDFAGKGINEQKLDLIAAKGEAVEELVRKTIMSDAVFEAEQKFNSGKVTEKDKKEFEKKAKSVFDDFKKGKSNKIIVKKNAALGSLFAAQKNLTATAKYIAKKTKFDLFWRRAKRKKEELEKKYPKWAKAANIAGNIILKGGTVLGASMLFTPAGAAVSAAWAAQATYRAWRGMKKQYKSDPAYKGLKFTKYMKDHKLDSAVLGATALGMFISGGYGIAGFVPGADYSAVTRRLVRGGAAVTVGLATGVKNLVTAKTTKERKLAWAMMGGSTALAGVAAFFGDDIAKFAQEKFGLGAVSTGAAKTVAPEQTVVENVVETKTPTATNTGKSWMKWASWGWGENNLEDTKPRIVPPYEIGQDPESLAEAGVETVNAETNVSNADFSRDFDTAIMEKVQNGSYGRSVEYTRTYMQAIENKLALENGTEAKIITKAIAMEALDGKLDVFKLISKDLLEAAASRGISAEEIMNLAHMEELQFHPDTYLKSYSETFTLTDGREYTITRESMANIVKGNCDGLSIEDQLKVIDHARSHYDMEHGAKVIAPGWKPMNVKAGIQLGEGCGSQDEIEYEKIAQARIVEEIKTEEVVEEKVDNIVVKEEIVEETYIDSYEDLDVKEGETAPPPPVTEEVIEAPEEKPAETQKTETLHEVTGGVEEFTSKVIEKNFIPSEEGGLNHVSEEKALEYYNKIDALQAEYSSRMIEEKWAVPFKNVHMVTGDGVLEKFTDGIKNMDVFPVSDGKGGFEWYLAGGGEMHQLLSEKYPNLYGDSFQKYSEALEKYGSEADVADTIHVQQSEKTPAITNEETTSSKRASTAQEATVFQKVLQDNYTK